MFNKMIHLFCCAHREKDIVEEFLESPLIAASVVVAQEKKTKTKTNEGNSTAPGSLFP
jgi:hypothetical protein